jgi:hypothetical protein
MEPLERHRSGGEALVLDHLPTEGVGERPDVVLHRHVDVGPRPPEEQISDHAPDQVDGRSRRRVAQHLQAGERVQCLGKPIGVDLALRGH